MRYLSKILILTLSFSICFTLNEPVNATKEKKKKKEPEKKDDKPFEQKGIAELTKKCKAISGLFTIYQDTTTGSCFILVKKEQLEKEFIYFSHSTDGVAKHLEVLIETQKFLRLKNILIKLNSFGKTHPFILIQTMK